MVSGKIKILLLSLFLLFGASSFGQTVRGIYISGISGWLGNHNKETDILNYIRGNGFNYVALYSLNTINWNNNGQKNKLASFISRLKSQYGVTQVGAVLETYGFMRDYILPYNNSRSNASQKFDVINQEFEFWIAASVANQYAQKYLIPNGYSCDSAGAFDFSIRELQKLDTACQNHGLVSEIYLGWPTRGQMQQIATHVDRILLHAYRPDDGDVYAFSKQRLQDIASVNAIHKVIAIFSAEPVFMGPWLDTNPLTQAYRSFADDMAGDSSQFTQNLELQGYQWFTYGWMPKTVAPDAYITANGPIKFCPGDSVVLTANTGVSYEWIPGGQTTQSITVLNPGSYKVKVTHINGHTYQSASTKVEYTHNTPVPVISAAGPTNFCDGGAVTLTSSSSSSYVWSNGATTRSITVGTTGQYTVTTGGACPATSSPVTVRAVLRPVSDITASGNLNICRGTNVTLTSAPANGYLWSNGATTQSITVSAAGNYSVNAYASGNCYAQSSPATITVMQAPARPAITSNGSHTLSVMHPTVQLTSSYGTSYEWSNGTTSRGINVDHAGTYTVSVTGMNGCSSTSPQVVITSADCVPPNIPVISASPNPVIVDGQGITLTSSPANGYRWSTGETTRSITVSQSGEYTVSVFSGPDCFATSQPVSIVAISSREAADTKVATNDIDLNVYPNPAHGNVTFTFNSDEQSEVKLVILDASGREVKSQDATVISGNNKFQFDITGMAPGMYFAGAVNQSVRKIMRLVISE